MLSLASYAIVNCAQALCAYLVATAGRLRELRQRYVPREVDLHELAVLDALDGNR